MRIGAVILAAGRGTRFGGDKLAARLGGRPVWQWSVDAYLGHPRITEVVVVCPADQLESYRAALPPEVQVATGGASRQESCRLGCQRLLGMEFVLIHDAARPFVSEALIDRVIGAMETSGAAAPTIPIVDTLRDRSGLVVDRSDLVAMQTPQGCRVDWLTEAQDAAHADLTDDIALIQAHGKSPSFVEGDPANFKITTEDDLAKARGIVGYRATRTGLGYDIHRFSSDETRPLWVGGVQFEGTGLEGHSDADALLHAIVDALLGAAGLGDIGVHFPNNDPAWKDAPSIQFLDRAAILIRENGWEIQNVDASVIAERPKVMPKAHEMRLAIAKSLGCGVDRVSIKATTNEGLGALGRSEGLAAFAVATLVEA